MFSSYNYALKTAYYAFRPCSKTNTQFRHAIIMHACFIRAFQLLWPVAVTEQEQMTVLLESI